MAQADVWGYLFILTRFYDAIFISGCMGTALSANAVLDIPNNKIIANADNNFLFILVILLIG